VDQDNQADTLDLLAFMTYDEVFFYAVVKSLMIKRRWSIGSLNAYLVAGILPRELAED
jgi:hypothetical protein